MYLYNLIREVTYYTAISESRLPYIIDTNILYL